MPTTLMVWSDITSFAVTENHKMFYVRDCSDNVHWAELTGSQQATH